jgi:outer membrane receptor protein involved in Fe transport
MALAQSRLAIRRTSLAVSVAACALSISAANAETIQVDEIVVTAQKREQSIQDIPLSISAVSGATLDALGADSFADYARTVPGLSFIDAGPAGGRGNAGGSQRQISIRGISSDAGTDVVGFYLNETPITFSDPRVFDIERVEILRGPQGTLYGSGSVGGTVRIITKQPDFDNFEARIRGEVSTTKSGGENYQGDALVNIPLSDKAAARISAYYQDDSGFIDNTFNGEKNINDSSAVGLRTTLLFEPTDKLSISPMFWYQKTKASAPPVYSTLQGDLKASFQLDTPQREEMVFASLTAEYDLGFAELVSATAYYDLKARVRDDFSALIQGIFGSPQLLFPLDNNVPAEQFVQEVRLASPGDTALNWIFGGYYSDRKSRFDQFGESPGFDQITGIPVDDLMFAGDALLKQQQIAVFGEVSYDIVDDLTATVGMRYFDAKTTDDRTQRGLFIGAPAIDEVSGVTKSSDSGIAPKASINWRASEDQTFYATVARGFRPGGPVRQIPTFLCGADLASFGFDPNDPPKTYEADKLWSYEVGAKTSWMGNRLVVNAAGYIVDWKNAQQTVNLACLFPFTYNTNSATSKGIDLEINFAVTEGLTIDASLGYVDAKLSEDAVNLNATEGESLLFVPEWSYSLGAEYAAPVGANMDLVIRADWQYVGKRYDNFAANVLVSGAQNILDAYDIINLQARLVAESWSLGLFVENLTDERVQFNRPPTPGLDTINNIGTNRPRTFGLRASHSF